MKKIKFLLVAFMAMMAAGSFAAVEPLFEDANRVFRFAVMEAYTPATQTAEAIPGKAVILGFVADYEDWATTIVPATVNGSQRGGGTYEVIGIENGAFAGTEIVTLDLSATKVTDIGNIFGTNISATAAQNIKYASLTTVKLPNAWETISSTAFNNCTGLTTIDFGTAPEYVDPTAQNPVAFGPQTIAAGAFAKTAIGTLDLSKTKVSEINNIFGTNISATAAQNIEYATLTTVKLPNAWETISSTAFNNCTGLTTVDFGTAPEPAQGQEAIPQYIYGGAFAKTAIGTLDLSKTKVAQINNYFGTQISATPAQNIEYATLTTVKLPNAWLSIDNNAFVNCTGLTTVDFGTAPEPAQGQEPIVQNINAGAFAKTAILSLDLTNTKIQTLNPLFETMDAKVTEVKLPVTLSAIAENAFNGLAKLTSVVIPGSNDVAAITINANAFKKTMKLESLELPGTVVLEENAFKTTYIKELTFTGNLTAGAVKPGAFVRNGSQTITVTYEPTAPAANAAYANPFVTNEGKSTSFANAGADVYVTLETTDEFGAFLYAQFGANGLYGVDLSAYWNAAPSAAGEIPVYKSEGASYAYAGFVVPDGGMKIAKKQKQGENEINVMVYGAYFDDLGEAAKSAILMDQLHLYNGYYYLPYKQGTQNAFIVKASGSSTEKVAYEALEATTLDSRNYNANNKEQNEIKAYSGAKCYAIDIIESYAQQTVYFLRDLAGGKAFGWKQRSDDSEIEAGQLYLLYHPTVDDQHQQGQIDDGNGPVAPAPRIVWLDGSEEDQTMTGIDKVNASVKNDGAIYNVAGQKVSASYKGLVIKDGKKFIQK